MVQLLMMVIDGEQRGGLMELIEPNGHQPRVIVVVVLIVLVVRVGVVVRLLILYQPIDVMLGTAIRGGHLEHVRYAQQGFLRFLVRHDLEKG